MSKILLSINPEHVENILSGKKIYEFRKVECKKKVDEIIIYSTAPVMKVVATATVEDIVIDNPERVWEITSESSGITKEFFDKYYIDKVKAVAYKLGEIVKYDNPKDLSAYGIKSAPQSFVYI